MATFPGIPSWPRWSPDGSRLRLTVSDSTTGTSSVWELSTSKTTPYPLLAGWDEPPSECCGSWTPDGKYFIFQATRDGKTDIWEVRERRGWTLSSSDPVRLTAGQMNSLAPMVSRDGKKLYVIGQQLRGELVHYDAHAREFVPYLRGISAEFVDFSRDGKWMTYVSFPNRICGEAGRTEASACNLRHPQCRRQCHDCRRRQTNRLFRCLAGEAWRIYLISADGGKSEPLLNEPRNQMDPNWSPDGNSVIFSYFPLFDRVAPEKLGIYMIDLKTRRLKKLPGSDGLWVPRWSPDGSHMVAKSADSQSLMLFDFATQTWSELTRGVYVVPVNWSADGRSVFYMRRGAEPALLRIGTADRKVEQIVTLKDLRQTGFRGAVWSGLTARGLAVVLERHRDGGDLRPRFAGAVDVNIRALFGLATSAELSVRSGRPREFLPSSSCLDRVRSHSDRFQDRDSRTRVDLTLKRETGANE